MDSVTYEIKIYDEIKGGGVVITDKNSVVTLLLSAMHVMEKLGNGKVRGEDKKRITLSVVRKLIQTAPNIDGEEKQALLNELDNVLPHLVDEAVNVANGVYRLSTDVNKCCLLFCKN